MNREIFPRIVLVGFLVFGFCKCASALPIIQETINVPVERLAENLKREIGKKPDNPSSYYALGRLYSLAYALGLDSMDTYAPKDGSEPRAIQDLYEGVLQVTNSTSLSMDKRKTYLAESLKYYTIAYRLSNWSYYALAYGWSCQEASKYPCEILIPLPNVSISEAEQEAIKKAITGLTGSDERRREIAKNYLIESGPAAAAILNDACIAPDTCMNPALKDIVSHVWNQMALDAYRVAYPVQRESSFKFRHFNVDTYEIARGIVEILEGRKKLTRKEKRELKGITSDLDTMGEFPRIVSPIIFSFAESQVIGDLICETARVRFDFLGLGSDDEWPWVHPSTAILVWDPSNAGSIVSGRQLIGSITWWIFWDDGFAVLQALDDNADGWLRGDELEGLAIWRDSDSNAVSGPGEVVPIAHCGIAALATSHVGSGEGYLVNPNGLVLESGKCLPLYDWWPVSKEGDSSSLR